MEDAVNESETPTPPVHPPHPTDPNVRIFHRQAPTFCVACKLPIPKHTVYWLDNDGAYHAECARALGLVRP